MLEVIFKFKNSSKKFLVKEGLSILEIARIENLDSLTNLIWLDLSFNKIQKIEGVNHLTKLTDLSLFSNCIEKIENMEALTNLNVLSIYAPGLSGRLWRLQGRQAQRPHRAHTMDNSLRLATKI